MELVHAEEAVDDAPRRPRRKTTVPTKFADYSVYVGVKENARDDRRNAAEMKRVRAALDDAMNIIRTREAENAALHEKVDELKAELLQALQSVARNCSLLAISESMRAECQVELAKLHVGCQEWKEEVVYYKNALSALTRENVSFGR